MAVTWQQTDTVQACAFNNYCSTFGGTIDEARQCSIGAGAGSVEVDVDYLTITTQDNYYSLECIMPNGATWGAGTWEINLNVTLAADHAVTWTGVSICRVNSSCVNQETIIEEAVASIAMDSTGVKTHTTASAGAVTPADGDKVIVTIALTTPSFHGNGDVGITPDNVVIANGFVLAAATRRIFPVT